MTANPITNAIDTRLAELRATGHLRISHFDVVQGMTKARKEDILDVRRLRTGGNDEVMREVRNASRPGLMTHVVVGYPTLEASEQIVRAMAEAGASFVELQIPFSDPLADGPTIQAACDAALRAGVRVADAFTLARRLQDLPIPRLFMAYFNTVHHYGVERFCTDAAAAGVSGLIVPDVPAEAAAHEGFTTAAHAAGLHNIITTSPATTPERLAANRHTASGFVYCMSRQGITGAGGQLDPQMSNYLTRVRNGLHLPLAVGFGISTPERYQAVAPHADIVVVGSAIIDVITRARPGHLLPDVKHFIKSLTK